MDEKSILVSREDSSLRITLNRPDKYNAMLTGTKGEIMEAVRQAAGNNTIRSVVITGAGKAFCAGIDLSVLGALTPASLLADQQEIKALVMAMRQLAKPIIAAVNGVAVGIGFSLALCCDIIIASDRARFGAVWVQRGLHTDGGAAHFLPERVGISKAAELLLTGRIIEAEEAARIGLVNQMVPAEKLESAVKETVALIARGAPLAQAWLKASVYQSAGLDLDTMLDYESRAQAMLAFSQDSKEALAAFTEKRPPVYKWS